MGIMLFLFQINVVVWSCCYGFLYKEIEKNPLEGRFSIFIKKFFDR